MNDSHEIRWEEKPYEVRCQLPRASVGLKTFVGAFYLMIGSGIAFWPILGGAFVSSGPGEFDWTSFLLPIAFFGVICFPLGGWLILKGLFVLKDRDEIVLNRGRLRFQRRVGPFWSSRHCSLEDLLGFRIESDLVVVNNNVDLMRGRSNLVAICRDDRHVKLLLAYPTKIIEQFLPELTARCESQARADGVSTIHQLGTEEVSLNPTGNEDRIARPLGSRAVLDQRPDQTVIELPAKGVWRQKNRMLVLWCVIWNGLLFLLTVAVALAGIDQPLKAAALLSAFWLVGIAMAVYLWRLANRHGTIVLSSNELRFEETDPLATKLYHWPRAEVSDVSVAAEKHRRSSEYTHYLVVRPSDPKQRQWFSTREKPELEWVATTLRNALNLESVTPANR